MELPLSRLQISSIGLATFSTNFIKTRISFTSQVELPTFLEAPEINIDNFHIGFNEPDALAVIGMPDPMIFPQFN